MSKRRTSKLPAYTGSPYQLYNCFRTDLDHAENSGAVLAVVAKLFPSLQAETAAILSRPGSGREDNLMLTAQAGHPGFWSDYLQLCRTNREPLTRIMRMFPHPLAMSDLGRHPGLRRRAAAAQDILARHGMTEAFAVPVVDRQLSLSIMVVAGHNLRLPPTQRHLLSQIANDSVEHLARQHRHERAASAPQHLSLTTRQMEIATWIVAGKSDWEIGEILRISPKTVNFHVENIKRTYGVRSRNQFVAAIIHDGGLAPQTTSAVPTIA